MSLAGFSRSYQLTRYQILIIRRWTKFRCQVAKGQNAKFIRYRDHAAI
eukprot:SAG31_NODE_8631_length_1417_cov_1.239757_1_plen_47_part_10